MGLATLMLLMAVSVPYVITTQYQYASSVAFSERIRASMGARSAADHGLALLSVMSRGNQYAGWKADHESGTFGDDSAYVAYNDPFVDGLNEFEVDVASDMASDFPGISQPGALGTSWNQRGFYARDDRSQVWSTRIEDEQGKVNVNTASPDLIGNILGSAIIENVTGNFSSMTITMAEGGQNFPDRSGFFVVSGVLISYRDKAGPNTFLNCVGGATYNREEISWLRGSPPIFVEDEQLGDALVRRKGALAIPVAAWLLPWYRLLLVDDRAVPAKFTSVDQIRMTANLPFFASAGAGAVSPERWLATRDLFTVHSYGSANNGWHFPQIAETVYGWDPRRSDQTAQTLGIFDGDVPNPEWLQSGDPRRRTRGIPAGTILRLRYPTGRGTANYVQAMSLGNRGRDTMISSLQPLPSVLPDAFDKPIIEVIEPAAININTAPYEVLVAGFKGLRRTRSTNADGTQEVTAESSAADVVITTAVAQEIASAIRFVMREQSGGYRPLRYQRLIDALVPPRIEELRADQLMWGRLRSDGELGLLLSLLVQDKVIEQWVSDAVMVHQLTFGTARTTGLGKWCYNSYGTARIDGVATTYAAIGVDTARAHIREFVSAGSDGPFTWEWLDDRELRSNFARPNGNIFATLTDQSVARRTYGHAKLPVLLDPNAVFAQGTRDVSLSTGGAAFQVPMAQGGRGFATDSIQFTDFDGTSKTGIRVSAGNLSFWHQWPDGPRPEGRDIYIFDSGESLGVNQMSLLWWDAGPFEGKLQQQKPGLTFRIADRTIEQAFVAVKMRPDRDLYQPGKWYHYNLNWQGTELSGIGMTVDGRARLGQKSSAGSASTSYAESDMIVRNENGRWVSLTTRLTRDIDREFGSRITDVIEVEDLVAGFWPSFGVIKIGEEAIEYRSTTQRGFAEISRAARGTPLPDDSFPNNGTYRRGERVTVFGFSTHVTYDVTAPYLPRGGSNLAEALDGNGIYPIGTGSSTSHAGYFAGELIGPQAGGSKETGILQIPIDTGVPSVGVYYVRGPAWADYVPSQIDPAILIPQGSNLVAVSPTEYELRNIPVAEEFIIGERVSNGIRAVRRFDMNFAEKMDAATFFHYMGGPVHTRDNNGNTQPIPGMRINAGAFSMSGSICVLVSVVPTFGGEYLNPTTFRANDGSQIPNAFARVQIGQGNSFYDYEWIQYTRLVEAGNFTLLAYTTSGLLSGVVNSATAAIRANPNANEPASSKVATNLIIPPFRETNPRSNINSPGFSDNASRFFRHLITGPTTPITPVFAVEGYFPGVNDHVTVVETPNNGAAGGYVRRVSGQSLTAQTPGSTILQRRRLMALDRHHGRMFPAQATSEVLKFPSRPTALPMGMPANINFGRSLVTGIGGGGRVDEVSTAGFASVPIYLAEPATTASTSIVVSSNGSFLPEQIGLIKVNDEYIAYRRVTPVNRPAYRYDTVTGMPIIDPNDSYRHVLVDENCFQLSDLTRGVLGSRLGDHGRYDGAHMVRGITIGTLESTVPIDQHQINVLTSNYLRGSISGGGNVPVSPTGRRSGFDEFGFIRFDPGWDAEEDQVELAGYNSTARSGDAISLIAGQYRETGVSGLFRGQYGTTPRTWSGSGQRQPIVVQFAVREPDFYPGWMVRNMSLPGTPSPEISHIQGGESFKNASISTLRWRMDDNGDPQLRQYMGARLYLRFNGTPGWEAPIASTSSRSANTPSTTDPFRLHVFDFDWAGRQDASHGDPAVVQTIDLRGIAPLQFDRIEWRVVTYWRQGAYDAGRWKGTLRFRGITAEMANETRILAHEEVK